MRNTKNHFWIVCSLFLTNTYAQHEDCERPPAIVNGSAKLSVDDNEDIVKATYSCQPGYELNGKSTMQCDLDSDEWQGEPPKCVAADSATTIDKSLTNKKRKKAKGQEIMEETSIESDFASELDLSCMSRGLVRAPNIDNGYVAKYNRRKKNENIFLVAFYECDDNFELEDSNFDRLYCSNETWVGEYPVCLSTRNGDDEDYGEDDGNYPDENDNESNVDENEDHEEQTNEVDHHIDSETDHVTARKEEVTCGPERGGCDHECHVVTDTERRIECSCFSGFLLDELNKRTCHDIDECKNNNGGCEQICKNKPGSFECACNDGLQIETTNGKRCVDINECLLRNGHGPCQDTCTNSMGSYQCSCDGLPGTRLSNDLHSCEDAGECANHNGGCSHRCLSTLGRVFCFCPDGYILDDDWRTCKDVNECEQPEVQTECQFGCENTHGSYYCLPAPITTTETTSIQTIADKTVDENMNNKLTDNDNNEEADQDVENFEENEIDDNVSSENHNEDVSGKNVVSSENEHQHETVIDSVDYKEEEDEDEEKTDVEQESNSVVVSTASGEKNYDENYSDEDVENDRKTNDVLHQHQTHSNNIPTVLAGTEGKQCKSGLRLNDEGDCIDINECDEQNTGCQHCLNVQGGYECTCPDGYELTEDDKTCQDINECEVYADEDSQEAGQSSAICSHECINLIGSYKCLCPPHFHLHYDMRTCIQDFCDDLINPLYNKTKCSHQCIDANEGFQCRCPDDYVLLDDMLTCKLEGDCSAQEKQTCAPGNCLLLEGEVQCQCPAGYTAKSKRCHDFDECEFGQHGCSHKCSNTDGAFECGCPHGLILSHDQRTCEDINECAEIGNVCGALQCLNTHGSYKCNCPDGQDQHADGQCRYSDVCRTDNGGCSHDCYAHFGRAICACPEGMDLAKDDKSCVALNPCSINNGGCSHFCHSTKDKICRCPDGYMLDEDDRTCVDIDECENKKGGCNHDCINSEGSFRCHCETGYELSTNDQKLCVDVNECATNNGNCDKECINYQGGFYCACGHGYKLNDNQRSCDDLNECEHLNGNCSHICINLLGSYQCSCPEGQILVDDEQTCSSIDECEINNGGCSHRCAYSHGKVHCGCPKGYKLDSSKHNCEDIDECEKNNGGCTNECQNFEGGHSCVCPTGYEVSRNNVSCIDVDECIENNGNCSNICINLLGSHSCTCEAGLQLEADKQTCLDVDECSDNIHDCSHICVNVMGTYECECPHGFLLGHDKFTCEDINECTVKNGGCSHNCVNQLGSYKCECPIGHELLDDSYTCADIDECNGLYKQCSHECQNTVGGFECSCPLGLQLADDQLTCLDVNECEVDDNGGCSHECENFEGSFRCKCPNGLILESDRVSCADVNECHNHNGGCSHTCTNLLGSFECECPAGHHLRGDNKTCDTLDPCVHNNGGCDQLCLFENGKSVCSCKPGFEHNVEHSRCQDIDECLATHKCQQRCINTEGSYKCECSKGYRINNHGHCIDIDECQHFNGGCSEHSKCMNTAGGHRCICPNNFKLGKDRKTCLEIQDKCNPLRAPRYGEVRCTRSRHKTQLYYRTKCDIWCNKGFKLNGPAVKYCNGTGEWGAEESICVPLSCPRLPRPDHGTISPTNCMIGKIFAGERCVLHCAAGFKPFGKRTAVCDTQQNWTPSAELYCVTAESEIVPSYMPTIVAVAKPVSFVKPIIRCPADISIILPKNQQLAHVRIEKPGTNVDWVKYVDSSPAWGKNLEAQIPAGVTTVTFRARSPTSNLNDICRVVITVKEPLPPIAKNCPEGFDVQLQPNEVARMLHWKEPTFESHNHLKQVYKSKVPGDKFPAGVHYITYVATDLEGLTAKCNFRITVKAHEAAGERRTEALKTNPLLDNHESYLICPGKQRQRIENNYPWLIPKGCHIKNYRMKGQQRQQTSRRVEIHEQVKHHRVVEQVENDHHHQQHQQQQQISKTNGNQRYQQRSNQRQEQVQQKSQVQQQQQPILSPHNNLLRYYSSWDDVHSNNGFQHPQHHHQEPQHRWLNE